MFRFVEIVDLRRDQNGLYLFIRYTLGDETRLFRWGVDEYTWEQVGLAVRAAKTVLGDGGRLRLSLAVDRMTPGKYGCTLIYVHGADSQRRMFFATDHFAANVVWLAQLDGIDELDALAIEDDIVSPAPANRKYRWRYVFFIILPLTTLLLMFKAQFVLHNNDVALDAVFVASPAAIEVVVAAELGSLAVGAPDPQPVDEQPIAPAAEIGQCGLPAAAESGGQDDFLRILRGNQPGAVSLTFDDGPSEYTEQIVDALDAFGVQGTFFFVGIQIEKWPEKVRYAAERGHIIGNHSMSHKDLTRLDPVGRRQEIKAVADMIEAATGKAPTLFRPPFGRWNEDVAAILKDEDMVLALWNRDPNDWLTDARDQIVRDVLADQPSGGIYVLHERKHTLDALPLILDELVKGDLLVTGMGTQANVECH